MKQLPHGVTLFDVVGLPNAGEVRCEGCGCYFSDNDVTVVATKDWYSSSKRPFCVPCLKNIRLKGMK